MCIRGMVVMGILQGPSDHERLYLIWTTLDHLGDCQWSASVWRFQVDEKLRLNRGQVEASACNERH